MNQAAYAQNSASQSPDYIRCRRCGTVNSKYRNTCWKCGEALGE